MKPEDVCLISDFTDYYDHWFGVRYREPTAIARHGPAFCRNTRDGTTRSVALGILHNILGLLVPDHGPAKHILAAHGAAVVYTDEYAHRGEGKTLIELRGNEALPPLIGWQMASQHFPGSPRPTSYRLLCIGPRRYALRYQSDDYWRSNVGNVTIKRYDPRALPDIPTIRQPWPLLAVDFVLSPDDMPIAIDLNTAPQIRGTPVEEDIEPREVASLIAEFIGRDSNR